MKRKNLGVWVDHKETYIVSLENSKAHVRYFRSFPEKPKMTRVKGGSKGSVYLSYGPQEAVKEQERLENWKERMKKFYRRIIRYMQRADQIYIMGPGEAKIELYELSKEKKELPQKIVGVKNVNKQMTEQQIIEKIEEYFFRLLSKKDFEVKIKHRPSDHLQSMNP